MVKRRFDEISNIPFEVEHYIAIYKIATINDMFTFYVNGAEFTTGNQLFFEAMKEMLSNALDGTFNEIYNKHNNTINNIVFTDCIDKGIMMKYFDKYYNILYQSEIQSVDYTIEEKKTKKQMNYTIF